MLPIASTFLNGPDVGNEELDGDTSLTLTFWMVIHATWIDSFKSRKASAFKHIDKGL